MNGPDFERFQASAQGCGVLFYYAGEFSPAMVAAAADSLKASLATEDASGPAKRKLFSTFVEMAHNVLHYAAPTHLPSGAIGVGREDTAVDASSRYWIVCSNPVDVEHVPRLTDKLNALRTMSLEEIKQNYREQLRNPTHSVDDPLSKGAGLGLLTIARDASAPLEYSFASTADPAARTALFHVKARI
ncbi:MAG: hypothetical protein E6Q94_02345 [Burkholderiaceae bacterium]|nr:MAG: hypothetical protein E6Q94_02345 [Burkholderiaceae bacterium]